MRRRHHREDLCKPKTQAANHNDMTQADAKDVPYAPAKAKLAPDAKSIRLFGPGVIVLATA